MKINITKACPVIICEIPPMIININAAKNKVPLSLISGLSDLWDWR